MLDQLISYNRADHVLVINTYALGLNKWRVYKSFEPRRIVRSISPSRFRPSIQTRQLNQQNGSLNWIQAEIAANKLVIVFPPGSMIPHHHKSIVQRLVIRDDHAAVADSAKVLARK